MLARFPRLLATLTRNTSDKCTQLPVNDRTFVQLSIFGNMDERKILGPPRRKRCQSHIGFPNKQLERKEEALVNILVPGIYQAYIPTNV